MTSRRAPRGIAAPISAMRDRLAPATPLARAQACWREAAGERIAAAATPAAEAEGVLTVDCSSAVWAEQLSLMSTQILGNLREADPNLAVLRELRFRRRRS